MKVEILFHQNTCSYRRVIEPKHTLMLYWTQERECISGGCAIVDGYKGKKFVVWALKIRASSFLLKKALGVLSWSGLLTISKCLCAFRAFMTSPDSSFLDRAMAYAAGCFSSGRRGASVTEGCLALCILGLQQLQRPFPIGWRHPYCIGRVEENPKLRRSWGGLFLAPEKMMAEWVCMYIGIPYVKWESGAHTSLHT
jgi:hypothetical protein